MSFIENLVGDGSTSGGDAIWTGSGSVTSGRLGFFVECSVSGWHMGSTLICLPISEMVGKSFGDIEQNKKISIRPHGKKGDEGNKRQ